MSEQIIIKVQKMKEQLSGSVKKISRLKEVGKIDNAINNENIYINVATLIYKNNALELIKKLNVIEKVEIFETIIDGKAAYKVAIGPFDDLFKLNQVLMNDTIQEYEDLSIFLKQEKK